MPFVRLRSSSTIALALSSDPGSKGTKTLPAAPVWGNSPATAMTASSGIASAAASTRSVALTAVSLGSLGVMPRPRIGAAHKRRRLSYTHLRRRGLTIGGRVRQRSLGRFEIRKSVPLVGLEVGAFGPLVPCVEEDEAIRRRALECPSNR